MLLAESLNDEGGEETGVPGQTPDDEHKKMPKTKAREFKPQAGLESAL